MFKLGIDLIIYNIWDSRMRGKSSTCACIYMFMRSHGWSRWFTILIVWRNGEMFGWMDIFEMLHGDT